MWHLPLNSIVLGLATSTAGARATGLCIKVTGMACLSCDPFTTDHTVQHRSSKTPTFTITTPRNLFPFVFHLSNFPSFLSQPGA
jgi:hypothetical protein